VQVGVGAKYQEVVDGDEMVALVKVILAEGMGVPVSNKDK